MTSECQDFGDLWQPCRIKSLYDMQPFIAGQFMQLLMALQELKLAIGTQSVLDANNMSALPLPKLVDINERTQRGITLKQIVHIASGCEMCGFALSAEKCQFIVDRHFDPSGKSISAGQLAMDVGELIDRVTGEMRQRRFYVLESADTRYYTDAQFDNEVMVHFQNAAGFDILEAGRCYALDRWTACVFHLMRVIEAALREVRNKYGFPQCNNWSQYKDKIDKEREAKLSQLNGLSDKTTVQALRLDGEIRLLRELWMKVDHMAHRWRNDVIHDIDVKYTKVEATEIFDTVQAFMNFVAVSVLPASLGP